MNRIGTGRWVSVGLALAGLGFGLGCSAAQAVQAADAAATPVDSTLTPTPVRVASGAGAAAPTVADRYLTPATVEHVAFSGGLSSDGAWLLYAKAPEAGQRSTHILARNLMAQTEKEIGTLAWQGAAREDAVAMLPRTASPDLTQVWVSAQQDRLWRWEPATGTVTPLAMPTRNTNEEFAKVAESSADGNHLALIEASKRLLVFDVATGKLEDQITPAAKKGGSLRQVQWVNNRLMLINGDLLQLWPQGNDTVAAEPALFKESEGGPQWVGVQGDAVLVRTKDRLCRWSPKAPDKLEELATLLNREEVLYEPGKDRLVVTCLMSPQTAETAASADAQKAPHEASAPEANVQSSVPELAMRVLDRDGKLLFGKRFSLPLTQALAPLVKVAEARREKNQMYFEAQLRVEPVMAYDNLLLIRLMRENRYGYMGDVFETEALVTICETPGVFTQPDKRLTWVSSGASDVHMPLFYPLAKEGFCVVQVDQTLQIYDLH